MRVSDVSDKILDENFGLDLMYSEGIDSSSCISAESVLTHHGIKGMKWGVRKNRRLSSKKKNKKLTSVQQAKRKVAMVGIGYTLGGIAITGGVAYAMRKHSDAKQKELIKTMQKGYEIVHDTLEQEAKMTEIKELYNQKKAEYAYELARYQLKKMGYL